MEKYEITFITKEDLKDAPVKKEIESLGGKLLESHSLGQKQMTFPIKKEDVGFYTVTSFEIGPTKILELNKKLGLKQEILRHLILVGRAAKIEVPKEKEVSKLAEEPKKAEAKLEEILPEPPEKPVAEPLEKVKKVVKKKEELPKEPPKKAEKPTAKAEIVREAEEKPKVSEAAKELEEESISTEERLKALDKKLDELLKE